MQVAPVQTAPVQEVFSSFQGEGPHVGKRQLFVRFAHCHLACTYCDTPMVSADGQCHITQPNGTEVVLPNPVTPNDLAPYLLECIHQRPHHSVSFTGGEPLLYHRFLQHLLPVIQPVCLTYLETSGTQPDFLAAVLPWVDIVAMDIKLPSATGEKAYWREHEAFLKLALQKQVFLKLIFNDGVRDEELDAVIELASIAKGIPLILQPETSLTHSPRLLASEATVFKVADKLSSVFTDVRVIPQTHKMLSVR